jgi:hypothetical protein
MPVVSGCFGIEAAFSFYARAAFFVTAFAGLGWATKSSVKKPDNAILALER